MVVPFANINPTDCGAMLLLPLVFCVIVSSETVGNKSGLLNDPSVRVQGGAEFSLENPTNVGVTHRNS